MGSEQQFCLRWNNHQSTLISVFDTLLESETLVDVTLAAEGQYLKAHKVVLSACSQYFQELLCHHLEKHPIIILKDVTFQELKALIDYMYRGEVNVSQEQLSALIKTAESLKIKGLADGGDRRPDRKSVPQLSPPLPPVLAPALSGNLSLDSRSMGAGDYATNSPLQHGPREGSISPVSRKRKRIRRRSGEGVVGGGAHEGEVGGGSEQASSSASTLSVPNIPATITPVNSGSRTTPGDADGGDDEGVSGSKLDGGQEDGAQGPASSKQTKSEPGTSLQSHSQTPLLEPKSEYREEDDDDGEADEDSMDNVVALDEDVMDMEGSRDDGLDQKAGPSHGAEVSGQGSGHLGELYSFIQRHDLSAPFEVPPLVSIPPSHPYPPPPPPRQIQPHHHHRQLPDDCTLGFAPPSHIHHTYNANFPEIPNVQLPRDAVSDGAFEGLLASLSEDVMFRKYSVQVVRGALEAVLKQGTSVTRASADFGIKRSTLQFYLKKMNIALRK
ncbi:longitudinals lacking protein, isoforms H/M/V isoform X12 [Hetaerina americana]|uniref:longitudinals lacking protein, isoforms H/M/V isoform X12 n=1 Tax=Hetaerina americana TaxID=62018 RepID=UPI003A7F45ED